jgi:hypothetical protein
MAEKAQDIMARGEAELIAILKARNATVFAKAKACQRLATVGTRDAVPALAALRTDHKIAHYARDGLEPIPDPAVDDALRAALGKTKGPLQVGVINSLGVRRDAQALGALDKLMHGHDAESAGAAAAAIARIGGAPAAGHLQKALEHAQGPLLVAVAQACLVCAEGGQRQLYASVAGAAVPAHIREAANRGAASAVK